MPRFGLALTKRAVNQCEDQMGMRTGMDAVFGLHHLAHAHNAEVVGRLRSPAWTPAAMKEGRAPMNLDLDADGCCAFRDEVRAWLAAHVPARAAARRGHRRGRRGAPGLGAGARRRAALGGVLAAPSTAAGTPRRCTG